MILADKIIELRKKNGWSQEELADQLGVSRQSVSKWEGAQSIPDIKKIIQMAQLFSVSTDYLLKDEIEQELETPMEDNGMNDEIRMISMEQANDFLQYKEKSSSIISIGVMLCILSPIPVVLLAGLAEYGVLPISEDVGGIGGSIVLLAMISIAVGLFISMGLKGNEFSFLAETNIETAYGVSGMVQEKKKQYASTYTRSMIIGIVLCVESSIPLLMLVMYDEISGNEVYSIYGVALLLATIAIGVKLIVSTSIVQGGFQQLLEEGDYTRLNKRASKYDGVYWAIVTTSYLAISFITFRWQATWIIWPISGVTFAAYKEIYKAIIRHKN